jgi:hypothetical protein
MPKPREAKLVSSVIFVDGEPFLITQRERRGFVARRLEAKERELVLDLLGNAHDEAFATLEPRALKTPFR